MGRSQDACMGGFLSEEIAICRPNLGNPQPFKSEPEITNKKCYLEVGVIRPALLLDWEPQQILRLATCRSAFQYCFGPR